MLSTAVVVNAFLRVLQEQAKKWKIKVNRVASFSFGNTQLLPLSVSSLFSPSSVFFSFSFSSFIHLFMGGWVGGYLPLLLLQVCLQRWLCQGAPWCPSVCTDRSGCQPVSMERQFHIQLIQSQILRRKVLQGASYDITFDHVAAFYLRMQKQRCIWKNHSSAFFSAEKPMQGQSEGQSTQRIQP